MEILLSPLSISNCRLSAPRLEYPICSFRIHFRMCVQWFISTILGALALLLAEACSFLKSHCQSFISMIICDKDHLRKGFFFSQQSHFEKKMEIFFFLPWAGMEPNFVTEVLSWLTHPGQNKKPKSTCRAQNSRGHFGGLSFTFKQLEETLALFYLLGHSFGD